MSSMKHEILVTSYSVNAYRLGRRTRGPVNTPPDQVRSQHGYSLDSENRPITREYANGTPPSSAAWVDRKPVMLTSPPATPRNVQLIGW